MNTASSRRRTGPAQVQIETAIHATGPAAGGAAASAPARAPAGAAAPPGAAVRPTRAEFVRLAAPFRTELLAHCYRMLGSVHDAEDLVQETYLRAWRAYDSFEGRSSLRYWLYRIATSACLTALGHHSRRVVPAGLGLPSTDASEPAGPAGPEISWIEPLPDPPYDPGGADPAAVVATRGSVRLALIVALQHLAPRQRAVLILRDVLAWRAAEVAELLDTSTTAVNSALQRARAQLREHGATEDDLVERDLAAALDGDHRALLDRYAQAFEAADVDALVRLLHEDATLQMPPEPVWFAGRTHLVHFLAARVLTRPGTMRLLPLTANGGQPALATYEIAEDGRHHAHAIQVLTLRGPLVAAIHVFRDPTLFPLFGLPGVLPPAGA
ncbi:RNA polymerase, sigma subunit, ECF family [Actinacidiphila yanglinensis]|uniref:RNA polymerase, sigma subunit, ECF family n=1 Tax=Actinacidiphila yanglinensis TaxID=310779 RepID=A0A1H6CVB8_9ACTN|nr:sigma-70 family RNA polymerase sigma factor [Actinacidiphila yanglinensis]SEG76971.1 RNA polymerase, sigma subunit, ECF family [Actinacidiphila yanglinensis]